MKLISKRFQKLKNLITDKIYSYNDAIKLIKLLGTSNFLESIESHIKLNIDSKNSIQKLKTNLILPHGIGKKNIIGVYTNLNLNNFYLSDSNIIVGIEPITEMILNNTLKLDILITTPDLISQLSKFGKILGPKGLMPSLKSGTVSNDLIQTINQFKAGRFEYKADKTGIVHINIGKISFTELQIKENLFSVYNSLEKNKPIGVKGNYIKSFYICTTMSPSLKIDLLSFKKL